MPKKQLPRLTDFQRDLCTRCYPMVIAGEAKAMRQYGGNRLADRDVVLDLLHETLMRTAAKHGDRLGADGFEQYVRDRVSYWAWAAVGNSKVRVSTQRNGESELEDLHYAPEPFDAEAEMDRLGVTDDRDEFEQVVWRGVSVNKAYRGDKWKWQTTRAAVAEVLSQET